MGRTAASVKTEIVEPRDAADLAERREEALVLRRAVGAVGPDVGGGVVRIDQPLAPTVPRCSCCAQTIPPPSLPPQRL